MARTPAVLYLCSPFVVATAGSREKSPRVALTGGRDAQSYIEPKVIKRRREK